MTKYATFLGCLIPLRVPSAELAAERVFNMLDVDAVTLENYSCCPDPVIARLMDKRMWLTLSARNLSLAEEQDRDIATLCNGCYETLIEAKRMLDENQEMREEVDELLTLLNKHEEELSGIGVLTKDEATSLGAVGPVLRASGVKSDIRTDDPYAAYGEFEFEVPIEKGGDVLARALIRARETRESISIVNQILENMPSTELRVETGMPPETESLGRVEAPRGELMYFVKSNSTNVPERIKIRTPTFMNDRTLDTMLLDQELDDLPLVLESIDRCISCTNRVTVIDGKTGKSQVVKLSELR